METADNEFAAEGLRQLGSNGTYGQWRVGVMKIMIKN